MDQSVTERRSAAICINVLRNCRHRPLKYDLNCIEFWKIRRNWMVVDDASKPALPWSNTSTQRHYYCLLKHETNCYGTSEYASALLTNLWKGGASTKYFVTQTKFELLLFKNFQLLFRTSVLIQTVENSKPRIWQIISGMKNLA